MVKKAAQYVWNSRAELLKYVLIGSSGFVLDMLTLIFFKEFVGFDSVSSVIINQAIIVIYIFTLNKFWTFRNRQLARPQFIKYLALTGWNYTIAVVFMYIFSRTLGLHYLLVRIGSIALTVTWNFLLYKHWIFAEQRDLSTGETEKASI